MAVHPTPSAASPPGGGTKAYAEVWGDTVVLKDLGKAIVIGALIAFAFYFVAGRILENFVPTAQIARTYAMLVGLIGCITAGAVCARLFAPKRDLSEQAHDDAWREETLDQLAIESGGLGRVSDLPETVKADLKEVGLYDSFARREAQQDRQRTEVQS